MQAEEPIEFEGAIRELERIVELLDSDDLELDEALRLFEQGVGHLRVANELLDRARGRIEELIEDASGSFEVVEMDVPAEEAGPDGD